MTRRGYRDLADEIRHVYVHAEDSDKLTIRHMVRVISNSLKRDNPRFDRERFYNAAIPSEND